MGNIETLHKLLSEINYFIKNPTDFLYEHLDYVTDEEYIHCMKLITDYNLKFINEKSKKIEKLKLTLKDLSPIIATEEKVSPKEEKQGKNTRTYKDLSEIIKYIIYNALNGDLTDETKKGLSHLSPEDILRIRLYLKKQIIDTEKEIKAKILYSPLENITKLQENLNLYEFSLDFMKELADAEEMEVLDIEEKEYSNIVFAPNRKKSTYFLQDIIEFPEKTDEMKIAIDKIMSGYFLKTKDLKPIKGYEENLWEYTNPNGIRVLYLLHDSTIIICSLFYKDKQKSTKIENEYEEAIRRFYNTKEYIETNFNNPDFHIEQEELKEQINSFLDKGITLAKKVGE